MNRRTGIWTLSLLAVVGCAVAARLLWQHRGLGELRAELAVARGRGAEVEQHRADVARLAALQPPAAELERLRADHEALRNLRAEMDALKASAKNTAARLGAVAKAPEKPPVAGEALATGRSVKAEEWANAGHATPAAAFETMLWAAAGGDLDALARSLVFDSRWHTQIERWWAEVTEATRAQYATPERLFAALTAKDVPIGAAQVFHQALLKPGEWGTPPETGHAVVGARITDKEKNEKMITFILRRSEGGWRILVPGSAVQKYRDALKSVDPTVGSK